MDLSRNARDDFSSLPGTGQYHIYNSNACNGIETLTVNLSGTQVMIQSTPHGLKLLPSRKSPAFRLKGDLSNPPLEGLTATSHRLRRQGAPGNGAITVEPNEDQLHFHLIWHATARLRVANSICVFQSCSGFSYKICVIV
jgi:hypothetical protein